MNSCIYNGTVKHQRFKPIKHSLNYKTFSLLVDLDEIQSLAKNISIFSLNKFNIFSFYDLDHGARDGSSLKNWVLKNRQIIQLIQFRIEILYWIFCIVLQFALCIFPELLKIL